MCVYTKIQNTEYYLAIYHWLTIQLNKVLLYVNEMIPNV